MILLLFLGLVLLGWALYEIIKDDYPKGTPMPRNWDAPAKWEKQQLESKPVKPIDVPVVSKVLLDDIQPGEIENPFEKLEIELEKPKDSE